MISVLCAGQGLGRGWLRYTLMRPEIRLLTPKFGHKKARRSGLLRALISERLSGYFFKFRQDMNFFVNVIANGNFLHTDVIAHLQVHP